MTSYQKKPIIAAQPIPFFTLILGCLFMCFNSVLGDFGNRATLIESLTSFPCSRSSDYPGENLVPADPFFTGANLPGGTTTVQELMITFWIYPIGHPAGNTISSTLFSMHQKLTTAPGSAIQDIFDLKYTLSTQTITGSLKNTLSNSKSSIAPKSWLFIKIIVKLDPAALSDDVQFWISNPSTGLQWTPTRDSLSPPTGSASAFSRSKLLFNLGYASQTMLPSNYPSCAKIRRAVVHFSVDPLDYTSTARFDQISEFDSNLLVHYEFAQSISGSTNLLSNTRYQSRLTNRPVDNGWEIEVHSKKVLRTTSIIMNTGDGFTLYFDLRSKKWWSWDFEVLKLVFSPNYEISVYYGGWNWLKVKSSLDSSHSIVQTQEGSWYELALTVYNQFGIMKSTLTFRDNYNIDVTNYTLPANLSGEVKLELGDGGSSTELHIDNVMIYTGTLQTSTSTCHIQVEGSNLSTCLLCKFGTSCQSKSSQTPNNTCPTNMMYSTHDSKCVCGYQYFEQAGSCLKCPAFCRGCTSANVCIEKDPNRDQSNGTCLGNRFDDGYSCIDRSFYIPDRTNYYFQFAEAWASISVSLLSSEIKLSGSSSDSFFFTITLNAFVETFALFPQAIAYIRDGSFDVFTITIEKNFMNGTYQVCYYNGVTVIRCFKINSETNTQVGMWVSSAEVILTILTNTSYEYETHALSGAPLILTDPTLCAGICSTQNITTTLFSLDISSSPFKLFQGITKPTGSFIQDLLNLMQDRTKIIAHYLFHPDSSFPSKNNNQHASTSVIGNQQLTVVSAKYIDRLKGLKSEQGVSCTIDGDFPVTRELSMSLNLIIVRMEDDMQFFSYEMNTLPISYSLIPMYAEEHAMIRVSYFNESVESKLCAVPFNKPSFLAVIPRYMHSLDQQNKVFLQIEIVADFCREVLSFSFAQSYVSKTKKKLAFPDSGGSREIYLSNIRFFDGSDFYFDYTLTDPCFMYYDTSDMKCLKTKSATDYLMNGKIMDPSECATTTAKELSQELLLIIPNSTYSECSDSFVDFPKCEIINPSNLSECLKCRDLFADPKQHCQCIDGYYFQEATQKCEECHEKCTRCVDEATNCILCKFDNTQPPTCSCKESTQYQAEDFSCQDCSPQCKTCELNADNCLLCQKDRIDEPLCGCDSRIFDLALSTNSICIDLICSYKCDSCEYEADNCLSCGPDREYAPTCDCKPNYFEKDKVCTKCPSSYYYDKKLRECMPCNPMCLECEDESTHCTECDSELFLYHSECLCSDLSHFLVGASNEIVCSKGMDVTLATVPINSKNCLVFTFDYPLDSIDFKAHKSIEQLLKIYLYEVSESDYEIASTTIESNKLILELKFLKTLSVTGGLAIFLDNQIFRSSPNAKMLDKKYTLDYLSFEMGPMVIRDGLFTVNESIESAAVFLKEENSVLNVIKQFQILFYFINTLQPCGLFLLSGVLVPPNLFQFLQIFGLLVFPSVGEYGIPASSKTEKNLKMEFFGDPLEIGNDISQNTNMNFLSLGITGSILVSSPIVFIQLALWPLLYIFTKLVRMLIGFNRVQLLQKLEMLKGFWLTRMLACFETSMLILIALSCNQYQGNINQEQLLNRISVYFTVILNFVMFSMYVSNFRFLKARKQQTLGIKLQKQEKSMLNTGDISHSHMTYIPAIAKKSSLVQLYSGEEKAMLGTIEKLNETRDSSVNYLYCQIAKKILITSIIVFMEEFQSLASIICASILLVSLVISLYLRPYKHMISNVSKIFGEAAQAFVWMCYFAIFVPYAKQIKISQTMSDDETAQYLNYGFACMMALLVFNLLYILEFIYIAVICNIKIALDKRKIKKAQDFQQSTNIFGQKVTKLEPL